MSIGTGGVSTGGASAAPKLWPASIPVCWSENASNGLTADGTQSVATLESNYDLATLRLWVREAVENTWGRFVNLDFSGLEFDSTSHEWPKCTLASPPTTIQLNFTANEDFADRGMRTDAPTRIRLKVPRADRAGYSTAAIRSFGQAIAVLDATHDGNLRPGDIALAQLLYARKHSGALVGWGGRCVEVKGAPIVRNQGVTIAVDKCVNGSWQRIRPLAIPPKDIQALNLSYEGAGYCLTTQPNGSSPTSVVTGGCFEGENWAFQLTNMHWHGWGGLCVTASATAKAALTLQPCNATTALQRWDLFNDYGARLRLHADNRCVSVDTDYVSANGGSLDGAPLRLAECTAGSAAQDFDLSVHDHIRYDANHCVQIDAAQVDSGAALVLGTVCSPIAVEQLFHISGVIEYASFGCLSLGNHLSYTDAPTLMLPCQALGNQILALPEWQAWDYHW